MRNTTLTATIAITLCTFALSNAQAEQPSEPVEGKPIPHVIQITPELVQAHLQHQRAVLKWHQFQYVELPRQRRLLDDQVRLLETEIALLKRRARDYRPVLRVGRYSPAQTAAENNQLSLQYAESQLRLLKDERLQHARLSRQQARLCQLEAIRAATVVNLMINAARNSTAPQPAADTFTRVVR